MRACYYVYTLVGCDLRGETVLIVDVGTLAHAIRQAGDVVGRSDRAYHSDGAKSELLGRLHGWPTGDLPSDIEVLVGPTNVELNYALDRWRNVLGAFSFRGYRFALRPGHVGLATNLFWWLVFDVPGMWLLRGIPQIAVIPAKGLEISMVPGRDTH